MLRLLILCWLVLEITWAPPPRAQNSSTTLPSLTREEIMATARRLAEHKWICRETNRRAHCVTAAPYVSDWSVNDTVTGIAYDWGGMDGPEEFRRKLAEGQAAGSHSRHGITRCTAGIDCSGFVSYCWGQRPTHE